jgi:uncharacterized membrane protein
MKIYRLSLLTVILSLAFSLGASAQLAHIRVLATFDAPGAGTISFARGINARGDIVGNGDNGFAYERNHDGTFTTFTINGDVAAATGITVAQEIFGNYFDGFDGSAHGYLKRGSSVSFFDVPGVFSTFINGANDTGNFVGYSLQSQSLYNYKAYEEVGGVLTMLDIPDAFNSSAQAINSAGDITGYYTIERNDITHHGFILAADGTLTGPIDFPKTNRLGGTLFFGLNTQQVVVGAYYDAQQIQHGLVRMADGTFLTYDVPGSTSTDIRGINDRGQVCGDYLDSASVRHCFLGQLR